jgi:hypothetical protein
MIMDYRTIIQSHLNNLLHHNGQPLLKGDCIRFASDDAVSYKDWTIRESNILEDNSVDNFLQTTAEERDWIHANLIPTDDKNFLITIRVGRKVGNPNPSVNVSFVPNHLLKIIS